MEFVKKEKQKAYKKSQKILNEIKSKLDESGSVKIRLTRQDFKDELSTNYGFGFQDLKKKYRLIIPEIVANYDVKFELENFESLDDFSVIVKIKNK